MPKLLPVKQKQILGVYQLVFFWFCPYIRVNLNHIVPTNSDDSLASISGLETLLYVWFEHTM